MLGNSVFQVINQAIEMIPLGMLGQVYAVCAGIGSIFVIASFIMGHLEDEGGGHGGHDDSGADFNAADDGGGGTDFSAGDDGGGADFDAGDDGGGTDFNAGGNNSSHRA